MITHSSVDMNGTAQTEQGKMTAKKKKKKTYQMFAFIKQRYILKEKSELWNKVYVLFLLDMRILMA